MSFQQLDSRLTQDVDFTPRDEITFSLLDIVTCPIRMEITDTMIIFNYQYYDQVCFDKHERSEAVHNQKYGTFHLKDPRTGYEFDAQTAIKDLYVKHTTRAS